MGEATHDLVARTPSPGSVLYRRFGDARAMLYGPHALLLQVMHPVVDAGVLEHSDYKRRPFKRLVGTVRSMATLVYGGPDGAAAEIRRLRALHTSIRGVDASGARYHALDPSAWAWVYATLVKGSLDSQLRFGLEPPQALVDAYYREARELGLAMGVRARDLPEDWAGFEAYFDRTVDETLRDTQSARDVLQFLGELPRPFFVPGFVWRLATLPLAWLVRLVTVGTLPEAVREKLHLEWTDRQESRLQVCVAMGKVVSFFTPQVLFYFPTRALGYLNGRLALRRERLASGAGR